MVINAYDSGSWKWGDFDGLCKQVMWPVKRMNVGDSESSKVGDSDGLHKQIMWPVQIMNAYDSDSLWGGEFNRLHNQMTWLIVMNIGISESSEKGDLDRNNLMKFPRLPEIQIN